MWFYLYNGQLAYYDPQKEKAFPYKYNHILSKLNHGDFNNRKSFSVEKDDNVYYSGIYGTGRIDKNGKLFLYKARQLRELLEVENNRLIVEVADNGVGYIKNKAKYPESGT